MVLVASGWPSLPPAATIIHGMFLAPWFSSTQRIRSCNGEKKPFCYNTGITFFALYWWRMTKKQLLASLSEVGLTPGVLAYLIQTGRLNNVPVDGRGNRVYGSGHVARIVSYLQQPRKRGRRPRSNTIGQTTRKVDAQ